MRKEKKKKKGEKTPILESDGFRLRESMK
jgi:hypothetical protein